MQKISHVSCLSLIYEEMALDMIFFNLGNTSGSRWPSDQLQGFSSYLASYWQHVTLDVVNIWLCPLNLWHLGRNQTIFLQISD